MSEDKDNEIFKLELNINKARMELAKFELELAYKKSQKELFDRVQKIVDAGDAKTKREIMDFLGKSYGG